MYDRSDYFKKKCLQLIPLKFAPEEIKKFNKEIYGKMFYALFKNCNMTVCENTLQAYTYSIYFILYKPQTLDQ